MRRTFKGWLQRYCCALVGANTTSVKKLCMLMDTKAPQALEAVFLYALECEKVDTGFRYIASPELEDRWGEFARASSRYSGRAENFLRKKYSELPVRLQKVLNAYDSIDAHVRNDDEVVGIMARKTLEALNAAGVTRYRLAKELSLNEGNVYAWLAGDATKVSRATARRAWQYAEGL